MLKLCEYLNKTLLFFIVKIINLIKELIVLATNLIYSDREITVFRFKATAKQNTIF